jgi:DNA-binding CsgD family transcriptional regulator/PAS domain-containing protein
MSLDERVLSVIETLYDAALDESRWPQALRGLVDLHASQAATFWVLDGSARLRYPVFEYVNIDPSFIQAYLEHGTHLDPTAQYLVAHPDEPIVHDGLVIAERDKDRHAYYDWHDRYSDLRFRLVGQVCPAPGVHAGVALLRARKVGRYESQDITRFAALYRHLERALTIGFRLGSLGTMHRCTTELLDCNPAAVLLIDEHRQVVYANRSAEALRLSGDGLELGPDGIMALRKSDNDRLQGLIAKALTSGGVGKTPHAQPPGGLMRVPRPSGKRPYAILVAPIPRHYPALSALRPAVCITVTDPDCQRPLPTYLLRAAFGLTEAESCLAARLAKGEDLRCAAAGLAIAYGTARARLAEIFRKTQTRRQGQLVRVLLITLAMP